MEPNQICDTTDYTEIKKWTLQRRGKPALLKHKNDTGRAGDMLKIIFPGEETEGLDFISWEQFFIIFEENNLKFLFIDEEDKHFYRIVKGSDPVSY